MLPYRNLLIMRLDPHAVILVNRDVFVSGIVPPPDTTCIALFHLSPPPSVIILLRPQFRKVFPIPQFVPRVKVRAPSGLGDVVERIVVIVHVAPADVRQMSVQSSQLLS